MQLNESTTNSFSYLFNESYINLCFVVAPFNYLQTTLILGAPPMEMPPFRTPTNLDDIAVKYLVKCAHMASHLDAISTHKDPSLTFPTCNN